MVLLPVGAFYKVSYCLCSSAQLFGGKQVSRVVVVCFLGIREALLADVELALNAPAPTKSAFAANIEFELK